MTEQALPAWLTRALAGSYRPGEEDMREEAPAQVLPGDLCVVVPFAQPDVSGRLFLVTEVEDGWCEGTLVGVDRALATEVDAVVPPQDSGLAYETVVHTRYHGPIWEVQIVRRVGAVESSVLEDVEQLAWTDEPDVTVRRGTPLQPEGVDLRYPALRALSEELTRLTADCRRRRHVLGRAVLDPTLADVDVLRALLRDQEWPDRITGAVQSAAFRDRLAGSLPRLSLDEARAAMLLEQRTISRGSAAQAAPSSGALEGHRDPAALTAAIREVPGPVVKVLSHHRCWVSGAVADFRTTQSGGAALVLFSAVSETALREVA